MMNHAHTFPLILIGLAVFPAACDPAAFDTHRGKVITHPDPTPSLELDPAKPFTLAFGRGSVLYGLAVILIDEAGHARISRPPRTLNDDWAQAELALPQPALTHLAARINILHLTRLDRHYSVENLRDGTQWVFHVAQGDHAKTIYCDNYFPTPITSFAHDLDAVLDQAGLATADWNPGGRDLENLLWEKIR